MTRKDIMYQHMIAFKGVDGFINDIENKFLLTEHDDSNVEAGIDYKNIITDQSLKKGDYIKMNDVIWIVIDINNIIDSSYTVGTMRKITNITKFVSDDIIYQAPSICSNITKRRLGLIYESAGITEADAIWSIITQWNDTSKKITLGKRFIINGDAWRSTALDHITDEGILYITLREDSINTETDDLINEVADGLNLPTFSITLSSNNESLYRNNSYQIIPNCTKDNILDTSAIVTYSSSDETIATVSDEGIVSTQSNLGTAIISVLYKDKLATLTVNVIEDVYNISLTNTSGSIYNDGTYQLEATCLKDNNVVSNPTIIYTSSNPEIATVNENGLITAIAIGSCDIICTYQNVSVTFNLEVKAHVYEITLAETSTSIIQDGTYQINLVCLKDNVQVSDPNIVYSSNDSNIATVSATGEITAVNVGNVDITCVYENVSVVLNVTVNAKPVIHTYTIDLSGNATSLYLGDTLQLNAVAKDNDITVENPTITWISSNESIMTIDSNGLLTSIALGSATITATFNGVSATLDLNVLERPHVYTIALADESKTLYVGDSYSISSVCTDDGTVVSSPVIEYSSSNPEIATIDSNGTVTTLASGTTTLTATYNGVSASVSLTVNVQVVPTYTYAFSQSITALKTYMTTTLTTSKLVDGIADSTLYIDYSFDSNAQSLISSGKIVITRKSDSSISIKNASVTTTTNIYLTVTDNATATKILDAQQITLTGI